MELKRTPLYEAHKALKAKLVDFGGWEMPVQYTGVIEEHVNTRERAGLFDVSHMGELRVKGKGARKYLNELLTNDIELLEPHKIIYSPVPTENGGVVDDILVYMIAEDEYMLIVNAGNTDKDYNWFKDRLDKMSGGAVEVINQSELYGQIAIQGPLAQSILQKLTSYNLDRIGFFEFDEIIVDEKLVMVSRTGYTGEDGFEIYCQADDTAELWEFIMNAGRNDGLLPVGLGARDTLRFESALPLYGHELGEDIPLAEAGLKFFVKPDKGDFIGKDAIIKAYERIASGAGRKLVGIELIGKGVPREGYRLELNGEDIGYVTSGTHSPSLKKGLAMGFVSCGSAKPGTELDMVIRDRRVRSVVVKLPFYKKKTKKRL